jgi:hypothetical protein
VEFGRLRHDLAAAKEGGGSVDEILQRVGAVAAASRTVPEARRRSVIASRLAIHRWPERELRVVAVDVESGARMVFDAASGVDFADAVAARTEAVLASVGGNLLDPAVREGAARAGREQGRRIAASGLMWVRP